MVLKLSINMKKICCLWPYKKFGFLFFWPGILCSLYHCIGRSNLYGLGLFLKATDQVCLLSLFFLESSKVNLQAGPCPCVDLSVLYGPCPYALASFRID